MSIVLSRFMLLYLFCPFGIFKLRADKWEHSFNQLGALAQSGELCISGGYFTVIQTQRKRYKSTGNAR